MLGWEVAVNIGCELEKFCTKNVQTVAGADFYWLNAGNVPAKNLLYFFAHERRMRA